MYAVPDEQVGNQIMAAVVLTPGERLMPSQLTDFLATQPDLSPKAWPRFVRINAGLPQTATNKILKRELVKAGVTAADGVLWHRPGRGREYVVVAGSADRVPDQPWNVPVSRA